MQSNAEIAAALYAAFARRDAPAVLALIHPEFTATQTELLPWGGEFHGPEGLRTFFERLLHAIESQVEMEEYVEAGDQVVAIGRTRGHVRATGAGFDVRAVHVWTMRDGRAVRFQAFIDTPAMLEALS